MVIFHSYVSLPEGIPKSLVIKRQKNKIWTQLAAQQAISPPHCRPPLELPQVTNEPLHFAQQALEKLGMRKMLVDGD